jgi:hypothetical protein
MIKSNGSLFTNQIINHFVNQNDKDQIDYLVTLDMFEITSRLTRWFFYAYHFWIF